MKKLKICFELQGKPGKLEVQCGQSHGNTNMKWIKKTLVAVVVLFIASLFIVNKEINVAITNSADPKGVHVSLTVEGYTPADVEIEYSMLPINVYSFYTKLGFKKIAVRCDDLKIHKEIEVFVLYKNNIDFEFTKDIEGNYVLLDRNSWFSLAYE